MVCGPLTTMGNPWLHVGMFFPVFEMILMDGMTTSRLAFFRDFNSPGDGWEWGCLLGSS